MNTADITKMMQIMMLQSMSSSTSIGSSDSGDGISGNETSMMFEMLLQSMLQGMNTDGTSIGANGTGVSVWQNGTGDLTNEAKQNIISDVKKVSGTDDLSNVNIGSIEDAIKYASKKYGVEEEFIKAVIKQESGFNSKAVSNAGAQGLMQLMPSTSRALGVDNPFNVLENIDGGTRYLKSLMKAYNGNKEMALAAYNGGSGRMKNRGVDTPEEIYKMPSETVNYVAKVMRNYNYYKGV